MYVIGTNFSIAPHTLVFNLDAICLHSMSDLSESPECLRLRNYANRVLGFLHLNSVRACICMSYVLKTNIRHSRLHVETETMLFNVELCQDSRDKTWKLHVRKSSSMFRFYLAYK